jgi:hypothetical protein
VTLADLARQLGVTQHAVYVLAGHLVGRHGYRAVIVDRMTGEITSEAADAIRAQVAGRTNVVQFPGDPLSRTQSAEQAMPGGALPSS